jgi:hypothetical protein
MRWRTSGGVVVSTVRRSGSKANSGTNHIRWEAMRHELTRCDALCAVDVSLRTVASIVGTRRRVTRARHLRFAARLAW